MNDALIPGHAGRRTGGFTLAELMVASGIAVVVLGAAAGVTLRDRRIYQAESMARQADGALRASIRNFSRDARNSGYGLVAAPGGFSSWIPSSSGFTSPVAVTFGSTSNASDAMAFLGAYGPPDARATSAAPAGSTALPVDRPECFNASDRRLILVGRTELMRVTGVVGGSLLVSAHPTNIAGLPYACPVGTPVELIKAVSYTCTVDGAGAPLLVRRWGGIGSATNTDSVIARHVERMKFSSFSNGGFNVTFTARAASPDPTYSHPVFLDGYRRAEFSAWIGLRN